MTRRTLATLMTGTALAAAQTAPKPVVIEHVRVFDGTRVIAARCRFRGFPAALAQTLGSRNAGRYAGKTRLIVHSRRGQTASGEYQLRGGATHSANSCR